MVAEATPLDPRLVADVREALAAEIGARSMYAALARAIREQELAALLERFAEEEAEQLERVRGLLATLGAPTASRSWRRRTMAWLLAQLARAGARSLCLRLCLESEWTVGRWYLLHADYLSCVGCGAEAEVCRTLATTKQRHARALEAWVRR